MRIAEPPGPPGRCGYINCYRPVLPDEDVDAYAGLGLCDIHHDLAVRKILNKKRTP